MKIYASFYTALLLLLCCTTIAYSAAPQTVTFPSGDGVTITADVYLTASSDAPMILLFHQAGWSRGEYREIAPRLNSLGYNCMAVDLRSGENVNKTDNETNKQARQANKPTAYLDAYPDMQAALQYARSQYTPKKLIVWGSSYSASLALVLTSENKNTVDGVIAFSPGEYFARFGKSDTYVQQAASKIALPIFITSARKEYEQWKVMYNAIPSTKKEFFVPRTDGNHGARALWAQFDDNPAYWTAVTKFLAANFPTAANSGK
jgi:dienelactone hydrolase